MFITMKRDHVAVVWDKAVG